MPSYHAKFSSSSVSYQKQIPSQVVEWGMMSMCEAERRLLANALLDISNEWFVLLSEACIPLQNFKIIYRYISRSRFRFSFMGAFDESGTNGSGRYDHKMLPEVNICQWRNRRLAVDIIKDVTYYPTFEQFCRPACYVDEHYFPIMLTNQSPYSLANRSLTYVNWSKVCDLSSVHDIKSFTSRFKGKDILVHVLHTRKSRNLEVTFLVSIITTGVNIDFYESNGLAFDFRLLFSIKGVVMETLLFDPAPMRREPPDPTGENCMAYESNVLSM
ncbi:hypothetical protein L1987_45795 [Smallanthus sonchifolius]|uniref:Uncharacterized protein n=1 Tax=Smallanthus sonchifolius TaxID=185202 RepID=A0ACB9FYY5_9ASTR|nr:hypothetical protein L1987_45795 [Smallanthus sonchifolius]